MAELEEGATLIAHKVDEQVCGTQPGAAGQRLRRWPSAPGRGRKGLRLLGSSSFTPCTPDCTANDLTKEARGSSFRKSFRSAPGRLSAYVAWVGLGHSSLRCLWLDSGVNVSAHISVTRVVAHLQGFLLCKVFVCSIDPHDDGGRTRETILLQYSQRAGDHSRSWRTTVNREDPVLPPLPTVQSREMRH